MTLFDTKKQAQQAADKIPYKCVYHIQGKRIEGRIKYYVRINGFEYL